MRLTRVCLALPLAAGATVVADERATAHLTRVLRLAGGAALRVFDGAGTEHAATLGTLHHGQVEIHVGERVAPPQRLLPGRQLEAREVAQLQPELAGAARGVEGEAGLRDLHREVHDADPRGDRPVAEADEGPSVLEAKLEAPAAGRGSDRRGGRRPASGELEGQDDTDLLGHG